MEKLQYPHTNYLFYIPKAFHHCTLDDFDWKGQTPDLIKMVKKFIEGEVRGLYLFGTFGVGKTHLLVALYRVMVAKEDDISDVYYISFEELLHELQSKLDARESTTEYVDFFCEVGTLFIDDITTVLSQNRDFPKEILRKIINQRYDNNLRTCFTSNSDLVQLARDKQLHPHAISRIEGMCEVIMVKGKDRRSRGGRRGNV